MLDLRSQLEQARAHQETLQQAFDRQQGYTAASKERRIMTLIRRADEAAAAGTIPSKHCVRSTGSDAKLEDRRRDLRGGEQAIQAVVDEIITLRCECLMCAARWDREHPQERF